MNIAVLASHEGTTLRSLIVLSTHPALLPKFGGKEIYGDHVFRAVLEAGESESGVSVHLVDPEYDTGPVVSLCKVPVLPGDSLEALKARTRAREKELVVDTGAARPGPIALAGRAGHINVRRTSEIRDARGAWTERLWHG